MIEVIGYIAVLAVLIVTVAAFPWLIVVAIATLLFAALLKLMKWTVT